MKKMTRILAMVIVAAMVCSMLPVAAFATETEVPVNVYYTGSNYTSNTVTIDGVINAADGYVDLTPDGVSITLVNETLEGERWGSDVPTLFTLADAKAEHEAKGLTTETIVVKYYVAQDDENVYLAIEETMPEVAYEVEGVAYNTNKYLMNTLRLGFNGADPSQQIDFVSDGFWAATGGSGTKWDVTYNGWIEHPFIVAGLVDDEAFTSKKGPATDIVADYVDGDQAAKDSIMEMVKADGKVTRTYELKLNKAAIEAEYAEVFGVNDIGFDGMFITMSSTDYEWANDADNYSLLFVTGTVTDAGALMPDVVIFGNEAGVVSDGIVSEGEYAMTFNYDTPVAYSGSQTFETLDDYANDNRNAESMSISFSSDSQKIYVGVVCKGATGTTDSNGNIRDGYALRFGFDPEHPENYIGISMIENCDEAAVDANDPSKTVAHEMMKTTYTWGQVARRGIVRSFGQYTWNIKEYSDQNSGTTELADGSQRTVYGTGTLDTYPITAMKVVKQTVDGEALEFGTGHGRTKQQVYTYWEIEFDKELLLAFFNEMYAEGEGVENLDTMLYSVSHFYGLSDNGYVPQTIWNGEFGEVADGAHAMSAYTYDVVSFAEGGNEGEGEGEGEGSTNAPETNAPETNAPTTNAPATEAPTTEAPAAEKKGCGGSVSVAGLALVAALGTCTVFVAKKKED